MSRPSLVDLGDWVVGTCLMFGASAKTAHGYAAAFVEVIEREWQEADATVRALKTTPKGGG